MQQSINAKLVSILRTLYAVARAEGAMRDGGLKASDLRPTEESKASQKAAAEAAATRVLADVLYPLLRPYEEAITKYGYHAPQCGTWADEECNCGLGDIQAHIRANLVLAKKK